MENPVFKYFPELTGDRRDKIEKLYSVYADWNSRINLISRKDMENLYLHHVLHSLSIAKFISFKNEEEVIDAGTGGGFPGIPLAIFFPNNHFTLIDSVGKKIKAAEEIAESLELDNISIYHGRIEEAPVESDYIVSRAVADLSVFLKWVKGKYNKGVIYLKGGDITPGEDISHRGALLQEIYTAAKRNGINREFISIKNLSEWFEEEYFVEKRLVFIPKTRNFQNL
ncbi:MAG: 16S rRNA (guanine(527)-N(7))-methyltransferase RsmG [Bacteroidales bacterium]|jgi:16S rRNA (guanine527-N7)-methyltransferase|nr:16S rRNA (guanine(527)-N(7))-methyltransferase RsmG [Bacteroidales bacterium]